MTKKNDEKSAGNLLGSIPKGTRLSKRITIAILTMFILIIMLIIYCLFAYTPNFNAKQKLAAVKLAQSPPSSNVDSSDSNSALLQLTKNIPDNVPGVMAQQRTRMRHSSALSSAGSSGSGESFTQNQQALQAAMNSGLTLSTSNINLQPNQQKHYSGLSSSGLSGQANSGISSASMSPGSLSHMPGGSAANYIAQNMQAQKEAFLEKAKQYQTDYLKTGPESPLFKYEIKAGTIIPSVLETGIDSDLPGQIVARVRQNVYDTRSGNYLLIPQGSTLTGVYDSKIAYGQSRVLIAWSRIIFPDGESLDLRGMPGIDLAGMAGLHDLVDHHYFRIFSSALLMSVFGAGIQLSQPQTSNPNSNGVLSTSQILAASLGQQLGSASIQMMQKNINIQPTIKIRPGDEFNVLVTKDIPFKHPYHWGT